MLGALLPLLARAQAPADTARRSATLDEVTVTGSRTPTRLRETTRSITVLDSNLLNALPIISADQALLYTPGVDLQTRGPFGAQADVSIRGGTFNQTLVLLNGVPLPDPQTGHFSLNLPINPQDIARVEILRGQAANVFGLNAFSGAINYVTKTPERSFLRLGAVGGEFGLYDLNLSGAIVSGPQKHYLSAARRGTDGHTRGTDLQLENLFYQGQYRTTAGTLQATAAWTDRQFGAWRYYQDNPPDQYETNEAILTHLAWQSDGPLAFRPEIFWRRHRDDYRLFRARTDTARNQHVTDVVGLQLNSRIEAGPGILALGADFRQEWLTSTNLGNNQRTNGGIFTEYSLLLGDFTIRPSLYTNWFSPVGWNLFPAIDLRYQANANTRLYLNGGRSYRVPTYTELYLNRNIPGAFVRGSENLNTENAWGLELGSRWSQGPWWVQGATYTRYAERMIDLSRFNATSTTEPLVFRNVTDIRTYGAEVNLGWNRLTTAGTRPALLLAQAGINYLDLSRNPGLFSRYVFNYPRWQVVGTASARIYGPLQATVSARYLARVNRGFGQSTPYWLLDARIGWNAPSWRIYAEGSNLSDTQYREINRTLGPNSWLRIGGEIVIR